MDEVRIELIMPSEGDMELVAQEGGKIILKATFYGNECMGPHIRGIVNGKVVSQQKLKIKSDGRVELKKAQVPDED